MTVSVNGIEIYYETVGSGRPLIMVHGNGEDHSIFDKAVEVLKDSFTCYLVDSRYFTSLEFMVDIEHLARSFRA